MSKAEILYMDTGRLLLDPTGTLAFHRKGRSEWPQYVPDPDNPGFAKVDPEHDRERHWTACGLVTYDSYREGLCAIVRHGVRRDNAEAVGRPCRRCWP